MLKNFIAIYAREHDIKQDYVVAFANGTCHPSFAFLDPVTIMTQGPEHQFDALPRLHVILYKKNLHNTLSLQSRYDSPAQVDYRI